MATVPSTLEPAGPNAPARVDHPVSGRRRRTNAAWWMLCSLGLIFVVAPVVWILSSIISNAVSVWHWTVLTSSTAPNRLGNPQGLLNEVLGTLVLMVCVAILAGGIGIGAGIYFSEVRSQGKITGLLRTTVAVLSGIPSIVFGYVGYIALVVGLGWHETTASALIVLSMLVVPYIAKATESALNQVPLAYREGGMALGMTRTHVLRRVVMRSAIPGIATGLIIALAISVGETAPLLYTAGVSNSYPSWSFLTHPIAYLTYGVYEFHEQAELPSYAALSSEAALLVLLLVVLLLLLSRLVVRLTQKYSPNRVASTGGRRERRAAKDAAAGVTTPTMPSG